jgi:hypothetical protein
VHYFYRGRWLELQGADWGSPLICHRIIYWMQA